MSQPAWMQAPVVPLPPSGTASVSNPSPSWQMAPAAPSWAKPVDQNTDIINSIGSNLATSAMGTAGLFGDIRSMRPADAPDTSASPFGLPRLPNPLDALPNTAQIEGAVNKYTGFEPYQSQTPLGHVAGSAASLVPSAAGGVIQGGIRAAPWALARAAGAGAIGGETGNIAADTMGEGARPYGQLAGDILGGYGVSKVGGTLARGATRATAPALADLKQSSQALYKAGNDAGVYVKPDVIDNIYNDVIQAGWDKGLRENRPGTQQAIGAAKALADEVARIGKNGQASLEDLQTMKEILRDAVPEGSAASQAMVAKLVDRIDALGAGDIVSGADPKTALNFINQANALWKQKSKGETIGKIISDAQLLQAEGPGRYPAALRAGFRKLAKDDNFTKYWTPDEQYAIKTAAMGGGIMPAIARWTGPAIGPSQVPLLNSVGFGVKGIGNFGTTQAARYADALARTGPNTNPFTMLLPVPRTTSDLSAALVGGTVPFRAP